MDDIIVNQIKLIVIFNITCMLLLEQGVKNTQEYTHREIQNEQCKQWSDISSLQVTHKLNLLLELPTLTRITVAHQQGTDHQATQAVTSHVLCCCFHHVSVAFYYQTSKNDDEVVGCAKANHLNHPP